MGRKRYISVLNPLVRQIRAHNREDTKGPIFTHRLTPRYAGDLNDGVSIFLHFSHSGTGTGFHTYIFLAGLLGRVNPAPT